MVKRLAVGTSLALAVLSGPAAAQAADVVRPLSVSGGATVPAGGSRTLTLSCPSTAVALNAALTRQGAGVTVHSSAPGSSARDWRFRASASKGARRRAISAVLRCVRLEVPSGLSGARLVVKTRSERGATIAPGESAVVRQRCGPRWVATGYGVSRLAGSVRVAAAVPTAHGWNFRLENASGRTIWPRVSVRCLRRAVVAAPGSRRLDFEVTRREYSDPVGPGAAGGFSNRCGAREFSLATGSAIDWRTAVELDLSHPSGSRGGRWAFARADAGSRATSFLVCLDRRTRFR